MPAIFYRTEGGREPVRDWLKALDRAGRRGIGEDVKLVDFGWPAGMPVCSPLGDGRHEVRTDRTANRIARVLFYIDQRRRMVLLHAFVKKYQAAPQAELDRARDCKRKHERGSS
ncbi:MAG TPA: type II toxin-antitoxin system RelE/ParE family toxin [Salinarimonas sp.]|nr:type II toxin-antitoxin system RelE/ParE family toxin [Salinarimonas sp.]